MFTYKDNDLLRNPQLSFPCFLQIGEMGWSNSKNELYKLTYEASLVRRLALPIKTHNRFFNYMVRLGHKEW